MQEHPFLKHITGCVCSVFEGYSSVLFLRDDKCEYRIASYFSLGNNIDAASKVIEGRGIVGWILKNKKLLVINDFSRENRVLSYYKMDVDNIKCFMGVPLKEGKGVLCVDSKKSYTFTHKDQKILFQFAQLIDDFLKDREGLDECMAVKNYYNGLKLICSLKEKYPRWDHYLVQLLKLLSMYTGFLHCIFLSRDERGTGYFLEKSNTTIKGLEGLEGKRFPINSGLIGWVFKNHQPIIVNEEGPRPLGALFGKNLQGDSFQTIVCLPLVVNLKTRGVLVLLDRDKRGVTEPLSEFFQLLTCHLSLFLENLYLKNKLKKSLKNFKDFL